QPGLLHRVRIGLGSESCERLDLVPRGLGDRRRAGANRLAVEMHGTGATLRQTTAEMGTVEPKIITQRIKQRHVRVGLDRVRAADNPDGVLWLWGFPLLAQGLSWGL